MRAAWLLTCVVACEGGLVSRGARGAEPPVDFNRDIRPILAAHCWQCHGPDAKERQADLRLDQRAAALAELPSGARAIVPGQPEQSALIARIESSDEAERMPPVETNKRLDERQRALLRRWVAAGGEYAQHWSLIPPRRSPLPEVHDRAWPRGEIDHFVLARLEAEGLRPTGPADRATLARRVYLDVIGLPPSPAEVDQFLHDPSPDAYEQLVDRALSSPRYGEKMALEWLDLARFGDTNGFHYDSTRLMWLWRDGVIAAFNDNQPFDQFTIEQLAGDLLPAANDRQKIASGFNRNTRFNEEGGADPEEFSVRYAVDRTNTLGQVWLGLTLGCAECHSHKYDPISQHEYYQLYAFFNSLVEPQVSGNHGQALPPLLTVPTADHQRKIESIRQAQAAAEARLAEALAAIEYVDPGLTPRPAQPAAEFVWVDDEPPAGAELNRVEGSNQPWQWTVAPEPVHSGQRAMKRSGPGLTQHFFATAGQKLRVAAGDRLFAYVWLDPQDPPQEIMLQYNSQGQQSGWQHRAYWGQNLIAFGAENSPQRRHQGELPAAGQWVRLEVEAAQVGLAPGMVVHGMAFTQHGGAAYWDRAGIVSSAPQRPDDLAWVDDEPPAGAQLHGDGPQPWQWVERAAGQVFSGQRAMVRQGPGLHQHYFLGAAEPRVIRAGDRLFVHVWLDPEQPPQTVMLQWNDGSWEHRAYWGADKCFLAGQPDGPNHRHQGPLPASGGWTRLEVAAADVGLAPGARLVGLACTQFDGRAIYDLAGISTWHATDEEHLRSQAAWELLARADDKLPADVRQAAQADAAGRDARQQQLLRTYYLRHVFAGTRSTFAPLDEQLTALAGELKRAEESIPTTMISEEMPQPRPAFVLVRGDFQQRGDPVERDVPAVLPRLPADQPRNRLTLARWLVGREHPLTARVLVNRMWAQHFGTGIVKTLGDFGTQGEYPLHPELLDWLAVELMERGWDVKALHRQMLLSATYRQSSAVPADDPELVRRTAERDPYNRLLSRMPRLRLAAEEVRDNALEIAGLLSPKLGGPSVMPYQPADFYKGKNENWPWQTSSGDDLYRRGLYTFWRRTSPYPTFTLFDAPSREECAVARPRTNTPLQALATLNDPTFVEAARVFAQQVLAAGPPDEAGRLTFAFRRAVARAPTAAEAEALGSLFRQQRAHFAAHPQLAAALVQAGQFARPDQLDPVEHAAWTAVTNALLNLDETITRE